MTVIYKYRGLEVKQAAVQALMLPEDAEFRDVQAHNGKFTLWLEHEKTSKMVPKRFRVFGTGWPIENNDDFKFLKTVHDGMFVWHVFVEV